MDNKKCSRCGYLTDDDALETCPECGGELVTAQVVSDEENNETALDTQLTQEQDENVEMQDDAEEEAPKAGKKIKIITASVAFVLVLALGFLGWHFWGAEKIAEVENMSFEEIQGTYHSYDNVNYFEFKTEKTEVEVPDDTVQTDVSSDGITSDAAALTDEEAASDASDSKQKTKTVTFDGTYQSGFTTEYVQDILAREYVSRNDLSTEYEEFFEKNNLVLDDYQKFIKEKGVSQSELDAIDKEAQYSVQRLQYDEGGYWNYDEETSEINIYSPDGSSLIATLQIVGDVIISSQGFFEGEYSNKEKFNASFNCSAEGLSETLTLYNDGNYIIKSDYEGQGTQYAAGTYKTDSEVIALNIQGQRVPYVKVKGGVAGVAFIKQK